MPGNRWRLAHQNVTMPSECARASVTRCGERTGLTPETEIVTSGTGPALHIKQPAMNHVLAPERDVGGRLIGVGIEVDAAHTVTGAIATAPKIRTATTKSAARRDGTAPIRRHARRRSGWDAAGLEGEIPVALLRA